MDSEKQMLIGKTLGELKVVVGELGMSSFTATQIAKWLYQQHVVNIDDMTNISKVNREKLKAKYEVGAMPPIDCQRSKDGTIKYLFPVRAGESGSSGDSELFVETVFIPDGDRATLCVSCQVGCKMNCLFCQTGKQGFEGNLASYGWAWSPKRITVSSVGIKNKLKRYLDDSECHVAISMHSPLPEQRQMLMPAERQMSITEIVELLKQYDFTHQRRCSFEYICFGGLNDGMMHARMIVKLLQGLECRVNLIRFHEIPDVDLPGSDEKRMESLRDYLTAHGIFTTIRSSRGQDIFAACGLLSTARKNN